MVVVPAQRVLLRLQDARRDHRGGLLDAADIVAELVAAARDPEIERADILEEAVEELAVVRVADRRIRSVPQLEGGEGAAALTVSQKMSVAAGGGVKSLTVTVHSPPRVAARALLILEQLAALGDRRLPTRRP